MLQPRPSARRGYTLVELVVSSASATMLMVGLASSLIVAGSAFRFDASTQAARVTAAEVQADLTADLQHALSFSERTATAVTFQVPDRDNDGNLETIRYAWSGTQGDPLTYAYNGSAVTLVDDVHNFDLSYLTREMKSNFIGPQNVLFVVTSTLLPSWQESQRKSQLQDWGYTVDLISAGASQSSYNSALADNEVVYVSEEIDSASVSTKLRNAGIGVVNGEPNLADELGFSSGFSTPSATSLNVVDDTHYITSAFGTGSLTFVNSSQPAYVLTGTLAGGLQTLGQINDGGTNRPGPAVLEVGASLYGGGSAMGRRVQLPWGGDSFNFAALNNDGLTLLKRAIDWAGEQTPGALPSFPVFENFTEAKRGKDGTSLSISKPSGTSQGDLLIAAVATHGNTTANLAAPAGWNLIAIEERYDTVTFAVWWKIAGSSESNSYTFSWSGGDSEQAYGWIMRFTGHDPASPINAWALQTQGSGSGDPPSPQVTTTVNNTLILRLGGFDDDDVVIDSPGLSGHTAITMDESNSGDGTISGGAGYLTQATAGASGTSTFSLTDEEQSVAITIAIAPAP